MIIKCVEREDGMPLLHLLAENVSDQQALMRLRLELDHALDSARMVNLAGTCYACGSSSDNKGMVDKLSINLLLGVHPSDLSHIKHGIKSIS